MEEPMSEESKSKSKKQGQEEFEVATSPLDMPEAVPSVTVGVVTPTEAQEIVRLSQEAALQGSPALAGLPTEIVTLSAVEAAPADVTDELEKGGPAFGAFVKAVGLAVADAQSKLDETLVATAKALSDTQIEVIAIFEQEIDNDGNMTAGKPLVQKLPLVNYLMPTAYQWTRVYLQADMKVKEFNGSNGFNIKGSSSSFSAGVQANYGLSGFGASGSVNYASRNFSTSTEASVAQDEAAGSLHMEATLEPRADIQLPRPFILQKGPRLKVTAGSREDIKNAETPPKIIGRQITLTAELRDKGNNALANKQLDYKIGNPLLNYEATNGGKTDNDGKMTITIKREGGAFDAKKPPEAVVVNVWLGLINEQVVINI
jgi:hypothetical protein